ncbi:site-2 protease family protein [Jeotgalibacillus sp. ET6]|uniref:M50 family metallopeptidase n=1 Tax=Jeotgalibacillus sp. ET6 TaxID=3037260 RepID=UPI0024182F79|nr:site-2 protease family protein [Jeotgalibacillus sp. ET6]MDG5470943.1 site-2 protease family protein [Jeotgalibacillus sp. ET6]
MTGQFISFFLLFLIIVIHECGHAAAAWCFRWKIVSISLLPFGGKLEVEGILDRPLAEELAVVAAGPIQHVFIGAAAFWLFQDWTYYALFQQINLALLLFNILPIWPLDGGRILFLLLAKITSYKQAVKETLLLSLLGTLVTFLTVFFYLGLTVQWVFVLVYVLFSCFLQWKHRHMLERQFWLERLSKPAPPAHLPRMIHLTMQDPISQVLHALKKGQRDMIIIKNNQKTIGLIPDHSIIEYYFKHGNPSRTLASLLQK